MDEHRDIVSEQWLKAVSEGKRHIVVSPSVEHSSQPNGQGSDIYLCGECGAILTRRPHGVPLGRAVIYCPTCRSLNESS